MHLHSNTTPDKVTHVNGQEYGFFSGFSYLGLHAHPHYKEVLRSGIDLFGTVFVSSRIANLRLNIFDELEETLADMLKQAAAASFSSGFLASQAAVQYAATQGELCYAPDTHVSLLTGRQMPPALSWDEWTTQTITKVNTWPDQTFVIIANSVNPLTSIINDFSWLSELNREVLVLIDDSHGFGVIGHDGNGIIHFLPQQPNLRYLLCTSLAKAFSTPGGIVAGHAMNIMALKKMPPFTAGTPIMPACAYAFLQSTNLHRHQRQLSQERIAQFSALTASLPSVQNPFKLPIFLLTGYPGIGSYLEEQGTIISSFGYPSPDSTPINRVVITALHQPSQLDTLYLQLQAAYSSFKTT